MMRAWRSRSCGLVSFADGPDGLVPRLLRMRGEMMATRPKGLEAEARTDGKGKIGDAIARSRRPAVGATRRPGLLGG